MVRWIQELIEELLPTACSVGSKPSPFREPRAQCASPSLPKKKVWQRNRPKVLRPDSPMIKIGVDTNRYSDRNRHSQTKQTLGMLSYGQTDAVSRERSLDTAAVWLYDSIPLALWGSHGNTQHFTLYFELCFDPSVTFSAMYSWVLYLSTTVSTHVSGDVRVSEGAHHRKCWGIVLQRGRHLLEDRWAPGERPRWDPRLESHANTSHRPSPRGSSASTSLRQNSGDSNPTGFSWGMRVWLTSFSWVRPVAGVYQTTSARSPHPCFWGPHREARLPYQRTSSSNSKSSDGFWSKKSITELLSLLLLRHGMVWLVFDVQFECFTARTMLLPISPTNAPIPMPSIDADWRNHAKSKYFTNLRWSNQALSQFLCQEIRDPKVH